MLRKLLVCLICAIPVIAATSAAQADVVHTLNFTQAAINDGVAPGNLAALGIGNVTGVAQWELTARSFVGFFDNDSSGNISAGDTFKDYIAITVSGFTSMGGTPGNLTPLTYGQGQGKTHELTIIAELSGIQNTNNTFLITSVQQLTAYFDANGVGGFTPADINNVSTYADGVPVESIGLFPGLITGAGNNVNQASPNGDISLIFSLLDLLAGGEFEFNLTENGLPVVLDADDFLVGIATFNNNQTNQFSPNGLAAFFGFNPGISPGNNGVYGGGQFSFGFTTTSGGQFIKDAVINNQEVPEPASLAIWGIGMAVAGIYGRRRLRRS